MPTAPSSTCRSRTSNSSRAMVRKTPTCSWTAWAAPRWQKRKARMRKRVLEMAAGLIKIAAARTLKAKPPKLVPPDGPYEEFCGRLSLRRDRGSARHDRGDVLDDHGVGPADGPSRSAATSASARPKSRSARLSLAAINGKQVVGHRADDPARAPALQEFLRTGSRTCRSMSRSCRAW